MLIGVDEAGRGPLAGPVVAAAVVLPEPCLLVGLDDSKKLSEPRRSALDTDIRAVCRFAIAEASVEEIDVFNILQATMMAMRRAVEALVADCVSCPAEMAAVRVLVDGNRLPVWDFRAEAVIGGDALHPCISAASILAKQHRDALMTAAAEAHPHYGWERNKGYGTAEHLAAIEEHGPSPLHRRSFAPIAQYRLV